MPLLLLLVVRWLLLHGAAQLLRHVPLRLVRDGVVVDDLPVVQLQHPPRAAAPGARPVRHEVHRRLRVGEDGRLLRRPSAPRRGAVRAVVGVARAAGDGALPAVDHLETRRTQRAAAHADERRPRRRRRGGAGAVVRLAREARRLVGHLGNLEAQLRVRLHEARHLLRQAVVLELEPVVVALAVDGVPQLDELVHRGEVRLLVVQHVVLLLLDLHAQLAVLALELGDVLDHLGALAVVQGLAQAHGLLLERLRELLALVRLALRLPQRRLELLDPFPLHTHNLPLVAAGGGLLEVRAVAARGVRGRPLATAHAREQIALRRRKHVLRRRPAQRIRRAPRRMAR
mmetsp:Transcript_38505/g.119006  ORF Transcript_38505/g.119006 Transcript_38505/m.119006 type:complete len:343 (+) Transcript_38505:560-1588(+)